MISPAALGILASWLLLLCLATLAVKRELLILGRRLARYGIAVSDGVEPGEVVRSTTKSTGSNGVFVFLFGDCGSCHEFLAGLGDPANWPSVLLVIGDGITPGSADDLRALARGFVAVIGEEANRMAREFRVHSGPLAVAVRHGVVQAKGYLRHRSDLMHLLQMTMAPQSTIARDEDQDVHELSVAK